MNDKKKQSKNAILCRWWKSWVEDKSLYASSEGRWPLLQRNATTGVGSPTFLFWPLWTSFPFYPLLSLATQLALIETQLTSSGFSEVEHLWLSIPDSFRHQELSPSLLFWPRWTFFPFYPLPILATIHNWHSKGRKLWICWDWASLNQKWRPEALSYSNGEPKARYIFRKLTIYQESCDGNEGNSGFGLR